MSKNECGFSKYLFFPKRNKIANKTRENIFFLFLGPHKVLTLLLRISIWDDKSGLRSFFRKLFV